MSPLISIIVPAYNAEKYLERCLNSIAVQTMRDFEVIVVDDGSTDKTILVCNDYAKKDSRIKVFQKKNGGASSARNLGLDQAIGEWIVFIDSDDYIEGDFLPESFDDKYDLYVQNWKFTTTAGQTEVLDAQVVSPDELNTFWQTHFHWDLFRSICCKFIKKNIVDQYNIRFDTQQRLGEDTLFFMEYIQHCRQIKVLDTGVYLYDRQETNWVSKYRLSLDNVISFFRAFLDRYDRLSVDLPKLAYFEYFFFSGFLSEEEKKESAWRLSESVLRMKELAMRACNRPFYYHLRLFLLKIISRVFGIQ